MRRMMARWVGVAAVVAACAGAQGKVKLGIDVLREHNFAEVKGKRVGLVCHPASVDSNAVATVDVLRGTKECELVALFGPEHGVYGDVYAGGHVESGRDARTGLVTYSLYGKTRRPTTQMVKSVDVVVFDLQDIGSRSYTYISTMREVLEECAQQDVELVILDRPNPLGGERVEGPPTVEKKFESFIGYIPVPYVHGMTMGEMALYARSIYCPGFKKLSVVKMEGWTRGMTWRDTGLYWVPTSPHIPTPEAVCGYASTGFIGEAGAFSNGVGYTLPFTVVGAPWVDGDQLYATLVGWKSATRPSGASIDKTVGYRPIRYKPFFATYKDEPCQGVQVLIDPKTASNLVEVNFRLMDAMGGKKLFEEMGERDAKNTAEYEAAKARAKAGGKKAPERPKNYTRAWDITCGSDFERKWILEGKPLDELFARWREGCEAFREKRKPFLLYQ